MLLGSFYYLTTFNRDGGSVSAQIELNPEHEIFKGHFPGKPVVPGVCLVQMMEEVLSKVTGADTKLKSAAQIKFLSFVDPGVHSQLELKMNIESEENAVFGVTGNYFWKETIFLKFKGEFQ